jgi:glyoxylate reductase
MSELEVEEALKPRVYLSRIIPEPGMNLLYENSEVILHSERETPPSREELLSKTKDCEGVLILLTEKIDKEFLDNATNLKVVSTFSVGYDHIDVDYATKKGIMVTHTPDVLTESTADFAWALILSSARRVAEGDRYVRINRWTKPWSPYLLVGYDVNGSTLGIVGLGRIGKAVAKRAFGFGMNVTYFDRKGPNSEFEKAFGGHYSNFDTLLKTSDIVSVHLPLDNASYHMFGEREFALMKSSAVFVNTSRGGTVDTFALYSALKSGKIFSAGIDVFEEEPIDPKNPLLSLENIVLSPHLGSASIQARSKMSELAAMNLIDALKGKLPRALANKEVLGSLDLKSS